MTPAFAVAVAGVVGLAVGSFCTVVAHRVPAGVSIVAPGSACASCAAPIRHLDNVPVLSYLALRGRCRACGTRISLRYPVTELATGALFCAVAARAAFPAAIPAYCVLVAALVALTLVDLEHFRLPAPIIWWTAAIGVPLLVVASMVTHRYAALLHATIAAAVVTALFHALFFGAPRAMGYGDVRLAGLCAVFLGWLGYRVAAVGILASFMVAGLVAVALLCVGRAGRKSRLPFGPFLAAGTVVAVLYGSTIARLWLN